MEIVDDWINVNHNYVLNIELSLIVMSTPYLNVSKEINMNKIKMT